MEYFQEKLFVYCKLVFHCIFLLTFYIQYNHFQKQPSRGVLKKRCFENMQQIYRRISMLKCDFNKIDFQWNMKPKVIRKAIRIFFFQCVKWRAFLKLPTNRPPTNRPPTKCTDHQPNNHQPIRNMRTRNSITNFIWISDKKIQDLVMNSISRMWVIILWSKPERVTEKIKSLKVKFIK